MCNRAIVWTIKSLWTEPDWIASSEWAFEGCDVFLRRKICGYWQFSRGGFVQIERLFFPSQMLDVKSKTCSQSWYPSAFVFWLLIWGCDIMCPFSLLRVELLSKFLVDTSISPRVAHKSVPMLFLPKLCKGEELVRTPFAFQGTNCV